MDLLMSVIKDRGVYLVHPVVLGEKFLDVPVNPVQNRQDEDYTEIAHSSWSFCHVMSDFANAKALKGSKSDSRLERTLFKWWDTSSTTIFPAAQFSA